MTLIHIIYVSAATNEMSELDLAGILDVSRQKNLKFGITGMLLYHRGHFMQVLEGESQFVDEVMSRIKVDARHHSVTVLERYVILKRDFANWSMGFCKVSDAEVYAYPEFIDFFSPSFDIYKSGVRLGPPLLMLKAFAKNIPI
jgi:hypothetical protein